MCSVQLLSRVRLFSATPWSAACQASLYITNFRSQLKTQVHHISDAIQPSHPLSSPSPSALHLSQHQGGADVDFSNESVLCIRWPKYWSFSFNISPSNEYSGLISFRISLQSKGLSILFSSTTVQKHQFFGAQLSL